MCFFHQCTVDHQRVGPGTVKDVTLSFNSKMGPAASNAKIVMFYLPKVELDFPTVPNGPTPEPLPSGN